MMTNTDADRYSLTPGQKKALVALNRALSECRRARLVLCGMDDNLMAYNGTEYFRLRDIGAPKFPSSFEIQEEMGKGTQTAARGVYLESGGW
jgi:hypothetical protein